MKPGSRLPVRSSTHSCRAGRAGAAPSLSPKPAARRPLPSRKAAPVVHAAASQLRHRTPVLLWVGAAGKPSGETGPLPGQAEVPSFSPKREETLLLVSLCCGSMGQEGPGASREAGDAERPALEPPGQGRSCQRWGASGWCEQPPPPRVGEGDPRGAAASPAVAAGCDPRGSWGGRARGSCTAPGGDGPIPPARDAQAPLGKRAGGGGRNAPRKGPRRSLLNPAPENAAGRVGHYPALSTSPPAAPLFPEGRAAGERGGELPCPPAPRPREHPPRRGTVCVCVSPCSRRRTGWAGDLAK